LASTITVTIKYDDNSYSYTESFNAADTHPSAEVIKDCENTVTDKWIAMGHQGRGLQIKTTVKNA
jgi:hypothetical protein